MPETTPEHIAAGSRVRPFSPLIAKLAALALAFCLVAGTVPAAPAYADVYKSDVIAGESVEERGLTVSECPSISAEFAALMDANGEVYFSREGDRSAQIASITKVMTAIIAIDNAPLDTKIVVSQAAAEIGESSANLQEGDEMDLETALKALLVPSGNDAAIAIAETVGQMLKDKGAFDGNTPVAAFVAAMNARAAEIGCTNTVYENPHGLDDDLYAGTLHSTAIDQVKVAQCSMEYEQIRDIVSHGDTTIQVTRDGKKESVELETTDLFLDMYDYALGIKTGMTDLAGPSFMAAASKQDRELYAVVLNCEEDPQRFKDAKILFEWYYDHVRVLNLAQSDRTIVMETKSGSKEVPVVAAVSHGDWLDKTVQATLADPEATISIFDLEGNVSQTVIFDDVKGTVNPGDHVGTITYRQQNMVVAEQELVAAERVEGPNPFEALGIMWQRFIGGFSGEKAQADSQVYNVMPIIDNNKTSSA